MDEINVIRWLFALLCGAIALQPRGALKIFFFGHPPEDADDFVRGLRLVAYVGLLVVVLSWIADDVLAS